jgi:hypothetical protein
MLPKKNLTFIVLVALLGVAFVLALIWSPRQMAKRSKVEKDVKATRDRLEDLRGGYPSKEHLAQLKAQEQQAETDYAELKTRLMSWWDSDVYDPEKSPREPGLFLGDLQRLRSQIRRFAYDKGVQLAQGVDNLGFPDELSQDKPPAEVTLDMLKERSAIRDILLLLIDAAGSKEQAKVLSIDSIARLGPVAGGKLYKKHLFSVSFTCKYPALAKFQADLVDRAKTQVETFGELPRNCLVIERLSYGATDAKVANLEAAASTEGRTTATGSGSSGSGAPPSPMTRPTGMGSMGGHRPAETTRPPTRDQGAATNMVGRMPNYNILNVTMTISMVDFSEEITGPIPGAEDEKKATPAGTGSSGGSMPSDH